VCKCADKSPRQEFKGKLIKYLSFLATIQTSLNSWGLNFGPRDWILRHKMLSKWNTTFHVASCPSRPRSTVSKWISPASTDNHLRANGEKNAFPFRFGYREANFIDKRGWLFNLCGMTKLKQLFTSGSVKSVLESSCSGISLSDKIHVSVHITRRKLKTQQPPVICIWGNSWKEIT